MKIACVDKTANDRLRLQKYIDGAFDSARSLLGHVRWVTTCPYSIQELRFQEDIDVIAFGSGFEPDELVLSCQDIRATQATTPILIFLDPQHFHIRTLRRLERFAKDIFSIAEDPTRVLFTLSSLESTRAQSLPGQLITFQGAKGGVGTTTLVSGFAHACQALRKSAVVIDLSDHSVFAHYMACSRWHSSDFTSDLEHNVVPEEKLIRRYIAIAPNNIHVLLPPAGSSEVRELWLRNSERFEYSLNVVDLLQKEYDYVLVDLSQAEGVLPFALQTRANLRIVITTNDPAAIHLASHVLEESREIPGPGNCGLLTNILDPHGLQHDDVVAIISGQGCFSPHVRPLGTVPFDSAGRFWIGTGNSFFTESTQKTQAALELIINNIAVYDDLHWQQSPPHIRSPKSYLSRFNRFLSWTKPAEHNLPVRQIPLLQPKVEIAKPLKTAPLSESEYRVPDVRAFDPKNTNLGSSEVFYEPPVAIEDEQPRRAVGSSTL